MGRAHLTAAHEALVSTGQGVLESGPNAQTRHHCARRAPLLPHRAVRVTTAPGGGRPGRSLVGDTGFESVSYILTAMPFACGFPAHDLEGQFRTRSRADW